MTLSDIAVNACQKLGKTDLNTQQIAMQSALDRHRMIYNSFDWAASQDTVIVSVNGGDEDAIISSADKVISARFNGEFLDPVSPSYIFESQPGLVSATGKPVYFWSHFNSDTHSCAARLYPKPELDGTLEAVIKIKYDDANIQEPLLPNIENVISAFVTADLWEHMRQVSVYEAKLKEAMELLQGAQAQDTPSSPRPRTSKHLTSHGSSLVEMTDSVCDIIGRWEPNDRTSIQERIRRNWQTLYEAVLLPENTVLAEVFIDSNQQQVVLPLLFDKVIAVRTNSGGSLSREIPLQNGELSLFFGIDFKIFERSGEPVFYTQLPSIATYALPPFSEPIAFRSDHTSILTPQPPPPADANDRGKLVFIKGEKSGPPGSLSSSVNTEKSEYVSLLFLDPDDPGTDFGLGAGWAVTTNSYDIPITISKPETIGTVSVAGATSLTPLLELGPYESERKYLRLMLLPNLSGGGHDASENAGSVLICGKRRMSGLLTDGDTPEIPNCQNILIAAAAADMLYGTKPDLAKVYSDRAAALLQSLTKASTEQATHQMRIVPYVENYGGMRGVSSNFP